MWLLLSAYAQWLRLNLQRWLFGYWSEGIPGLGSSWQSRRERQCIIWTIKAIICCWQCFIKSQWADSYTEGMVFEGNNHFHSVFMIELIKLSYSCHSTRNLWSIYNCKFLSLTHLGGNPSQSVNYNQKMAGWLFTVDIFLCGSDIQLCALPSCFRLRVSWIIMTLSVSQLFISLQHTVSHSL